MAPLPNRRPVASGLAGSRTVASTSTMSDLVDTATLVRGRVYSFRWKGEAIEFMHGVETVLTDYADNKALADALEELHAEVRDSDNEAFEKPLFSVQRGVTRPTVQADARQINRRVTRLPPRIPPRPVAR